jgi:F-type H+-transporting ATPase subunit beta
MPADDFTDPAVTAISSHLDSMIVLAAHSGLQGAMVCNLGGTSALGGLTPDLLWRRHTQITSYFSAATRSKKDPRYEH